MSKLKELNSAFASACNVKNETMAKIVMWSTLAYIAIVTSCFCIWGLKGFQIVTISSAMLVASPVSTIICFVVTDKWQFLLSFVSRKCSGTGILIYAFLSAAILSGISLTVADEIGILSAGASVVSDMLIILAFMYFAPAIFCYIAKYAWKGAKATNNAINKKASKFAEDYEKIGPGD